MGYDVVTERYRCNRLTADEDAAKGNAVRQKESNSGRCITARLTGLNASTYLGTFAWKVATFKGGSLKSRRMSLAVASF